MTEIKCESCGGDTNVDAVKTVDMNRNPEVYEIRHCWRCRKTRYVRLDREKTTA